MSRKIEVQILGDSKSLEAALGRSQQKTSKFGQALSVGAKVGAGALLGLGVAAKIGFDELSQHLKVVAQTNAVLKSTGGAANVTAGHVDDLSRSISNYSGQDDEAVQSSENLLLTFKNIQNQAGMTNDVFDQATKATADLSQAMGIDLQSAALQVGKALNDPEKGMKRLQRIGVQFTDDQVKLVAALVKSGKTQEAQKVILGELNQEFGGSAKAFGKTMPGQIKILTESFRNLTGQLVSALLPAVLSLTGVLTSGVTWMRRNQEATKILVVAIAALAAGVIIVNAVYKVWATATKVVTAAQWLLNAALDANPVVLITIGIIALGVALVVAYKKSQTFRNVVNGAFNAVKAVAGAVIGFIRDHWKALLLLIPGIGPILFLVVGHLKTLRSAAGAVLGFVHDKFQTVINAVKSLWGWIQSVISAIGDLVGKISSIPTGILDKLSGAAGAVGGLFGHAIVAGGTGSKPINSYTYAGGRGEFTRQQINVFLDGKQIHSSVVNSDKNYRRQNGRSAFA